MIAYSYDKITKQYIGTKTCQLDPLETKKTGRNVWLLPAHSTFTIPPVNKDGFNIIWDGVNWEYEKIHIEPEPVVEPEPEPIVEPEPEPEIEPEPELTLEETKEAKLTELKQIRDTKELEPIEYDGNNYDFDLKSYNRIMAAVDVLDRKDAEYQQLLSTLPEEELITTNQNLLEPLPNYQRPSIAWTTADNNNVELTADGLHGIIAAAAERSNTLHIQYRILKMAVENTDSIPSVQAIEWDNYEDYN